MRLLALDVGESIGVASTIEGVISTSTLHSMQEVWNLIIASDWDAIVYETFNATIISSHGLHTVQLIGGVRALCWSRNIKCLSQTPQARISYVKEAKQLLNRRGLPCTRHEVDALAHLLLFENVLKINGRSEDQKTLT